jgi:hypothetical protein
MAAVTAVDGSWPRISHVRPVGDEEFMATCLGEFSAGERRRADRLVDIALRSYRRALDSRVSLSAETAAGVCR